MRDTASWLHNDGDFRRLRKGTGVLVGNLDEIVASWKGIEGFGIGIGSDV